MSAHAHPTLRQVASIESLHRAWLNVKANRGAAGGDGITTGRFGRMLDTHLVALSDDLLLGTYRPGPVRTVTIRGPRKDRRITMLCLRDRVAQRAVLDAIGPLCERQFLPSSFGYRPGRSLHDAVHRIVTLRDRGKTTVIDADILRCFERLDHQLVHRSLEAMLPRLDPDLVNLIDTWTRIRPQQRPGTPARWRGIVLGVPLSPLLCNCYLHTLDDRLARRRLALVRYADDFVICCESPDEAEIAMLALAAILRDLRLQVNEHKTRITSFAEGFAFLGVQFAGNSVVYTVEGMRIVQDAFPQPWFPPIPDDYPA